MIDKEYLQLHAEHRAELEDELRRYELLEGHSYYKSPSNTDGMPHAIGCASDKIGNTIMEKVDAESVIERLEELVNKETYEIENVLQLLEKAQQKTVIRIKYFNRYDWNDVALFMFGDRGDYAANTEKYKQQAQRIHGNALSNMVKLQKSS